VFDIIASFIKKKCIDTNKELLDFANFLDKIVIHSSENIASCVDVANAYADKSLVGTLRQRLIIKQENIFNVDSLHQAINQIVLPAWKNKALSTRLAFLWTQLPYIRFVVMDAATSAWLINCLTPPSAKGKINPLLQEKVLEICSSIMQHPSYDVVDVEQAVQEKCDEKPDAENNGYLHVLDVLALYMYISKELKLRIPPKCVAQQSESNSQQQLSQSGPNSQQQLSQSGPNSQQTAHEENGRWSLRCRLFKAYYDYQRADLEKFMKNLESNGDFTDRFVEFSLKRIAVFRQDALAGIAIVFKDDFDFAQFQPQHTTLHKIVLPILIAYLELYCAIPLSDYAPTLLAGDVIHAMKAEIEVPAPNFPHEVGVAYNVFIKAKPNSGWVLDTTSFGYNSTKGGAPIEFTPKPAVTTVAARKTQPVNNGGNGRLPAAAGAAPSRPNRGNADSDADSDSEHTYDDGM
jgi:hypothetical protein